VEAEAHLEHVVGERLVLLAALLGVHHHVLPQLVLRLLVGVDGRLAGGGLAAVAAGGHPDAGEAVGGLADGAVVLGAEELPQREHGLGEAVLDDAGAGGGEQLAEVGVAVADEQLEFVGVGAEAVGDVVPGGAAGTHLGGPGEEFVGRGGHDGTRGLRGRNSVHPYRKLRFGARQEIRGEFRSGFCLTLADRPVKLGGVIG